MQIQDAQQKQKSHKILSELVERRSLAHTKAVADRVKQERRILKQERRLQKEQQQTETRKLMEKRQMFEQMRLCSEEAEQQKAQRLRQEREEDRRTLEEYEHRLVEGDRQREVTLLLLLPANSLFSEASMSSIAARGQGPEQEGLASSRTGLETEDEHIQTRRSDNARTGAEGDVRMGEEGEGESHQAY